jgi:hypothetical protein
VTCFGISFESERQLSATLQTGSATQKQPLFLSSGSGKACILIVFGPLAAQVKSHPALSDFSAKLFNVMDEVTAITRGPVRAMAAAVGSA